MKGSDQKEERRAKPEVGKGEVWGKHSARGTGPPPQAGGCLRKEGRREGRRHPCQDHNTCVQAPPHAQTPSPAAAAICAPSHHARIGWTECVSQRTITVSSNIKQQRLGVLQRMQAGRPPPWAPAPAVQLAGVGQPPGDGAENHVRGERKVVRGWRRLPLAAPPLACNGGWQHILLLSVLGGFVVGMAGIR